jgi:hypothetical protein
VGMGWVRTELPGSLGAVGCNGMFVKELPIVGEGGPESLVIYHQGSMAGYTSSIFLLPTTDITVVVLKIIFNSTKQPTGSANFSWKPY